MWIRGAFLVYSFHCLSKILLTIHQLQCSFLSNPVMLSLLYPHKLMPYVHTLSLKIMASSSSQASADHIWPSPFSFELSALRKRGRLIDFFCGLVVNGSAYFPTRWHPTNLAWLPSLKRQHFAAAAGRTWGSLLCSALPCLRSTSNMSFWDPCHVWCILVAVQHGLCSCTQTCKGATWLAVRIHYIYLGSLQEVMIGYSRRYVSLSLVYWIMIKILKTYLIFFSGNVLLDS